MKEEEKRFKKKKKKPNYCHDSCSLHVHKRLRGQLRVKRNVKGGTMLKKYGVTVQRPANKRCGTVLPLMLSLSPPTPPPPHTKTASVS